MNQEEEKEWFITQHPDGYEIRVSGTECYDALQQVKVETAYRRWKDANGNEVLKITPLALRYTFPQELETLLRQGPSRADVTTLEITDLPPAAVGRSGFDIR